MPKGARVAVGILLAAGSKTPAGTTCRIAATALRKARRSRRPPIADAVVFGIVRSFVLGCQVPVQRGESGSRVQRSISSRSW
jgi:hypothetical protein